MRDILRSWPGLFKKKVSVAYKTKEGQELFLIKRQKKNVTAKGIVQPAIGSWIREEIALKDILGAIDEIGIWVVDELIVSNQ